MVLYGLIKNMPKAQAMTVTLGGAIALSYTCFAFLRYTGAYQARFDPAGATPSWRYGARLCAVGPSECGIILAVTATLSDRFTDTVCVCVC